MCCADQRVPLPDVWCKSGSLLDCRNRRRLGHRSEERASESNAPQLTRISVGGRPKSHITTYGSLRIMKVL